jgi:UDP-N-acetyl-D-mannosaminuronic acid transferase (WecB/TagA/CpsF family)
MKIFNIQLDNIKYIDFFKKITSFEKQEIVFTPNPEILLKTIPDKEFESLLNKATILTPDGI